MKTYNEILNHVQGYGSHHPNMGPGFDNPATAQQVATELASMLYELQNCTIRNWLSIGVCAAGLERIASEILPIKNIFLIDIGLNPYSVMPNLPLDYWDNVKNIKNSGGVYQFWGDSHSQAAKTFLDMISRCGDIDFCFIDGLHTYNAVKNDTQLVIDKLSIGGYLGFHDIGIPEINAWINELKSGVYPNLKHINDYDTERNMGISLFKTL